MPKRYISAADQRLIVERADRRCEYCQSFMDYSSQSFVFEHVVPVALGGETRLDNLALACGGCNGHKYTKVEALDPLGQAVVPLYHPRQQEWDEHFAWSPDCLQVNGLTSVGRATVSALNMNRTGVINMRQLLIMAGLHPPSKPSD